MFALNWIASRLPYFNRIWRTKIRAWHLLVPVLALATILNFSTPANAIFLGNLERFFSNIASEASSNGEGVSEETVGLIFNVIRGIFLLLVAAGARGDSADSSRDVGLALEAV